MHGALLGGSAMAQWPGRGIAWSEAALSWYHGCRFGRFCMRCRAQIGVYSGCAPSGVWEDGPALYFWGVVAASHSAMIAIHPGRISTITASWRAGRRRDDANQLTWKGMYTHLRLLNYFERVCSNALGGFKWHVVVSRSRLFLPVHVVRSSRLRDWIMASFSMIYNAWCRSMKKNPYRHACVYHVGLVSYLLQVAWPGVVSCVSYVWSIICIINNKSM